MGYRKLTTIDTNTLLKIGDIPKLNTNDKSNIVNAINENVTQLSKKANQSYVDSKFGNMGNTKTYKGSCIFTNLPTSGMNVDDYWYITDKSTNYCYNGSTWGDIGNNLNISNKSISEDKTTFLLCGKNLFNPNTVYVGFEVDYNTGLLVSNSDHVASDYISILSNTTYIMNQKYNIAFYDSSKIFISTSKITGSQASGTSFTTPSNACFVRISVTSLISNSNIASQTQLEQSNSVTSFESFAYKFNSSAIPHKAISYNCLTDNLTNDSLYEMYELISQNCTGFKVSTFTNSSLSENIITGTANVGQYVVLNPYFLISGKKYICTFSYTASNNSTCSFRLFAGSWIGVVYTSPNQTGGCQLTGSFTFTPTQTCSIGLNINSETGTGANITCTLKIFDVTDIPSNYLNFIDFTDFPSYKILRVADLAINTAQNANNLWSGKLWTANGDSITAQNYYPQLVATALGINLTNVGVGGTRVADITGVDTTAFCRDERINTYSSSSDLVTIMGGTNDWQSNVPLGDYTYNNGFITSTFKGALAETIIKIQAQCPHALIVVCSNIGGRGTASGVTGTMPIQNSIGLTAYDYANASKDVAENLNVPFIDTWACGINCFNRNIYIQDTVHPTMLGATLIARKIIGDLKALAPIG